MSADRRARLEAQRRGESYTYLHILNEADPTCPSAAAGTHPNIVGF